MQWQWRAMRYEIHSGLLQLQCSTQGRMGNRCKSQWRVPAAALLYYASPCFPRHYPVRSLHFLICTKEWGVRAKRPLGDKGRESGAAGIEHNAPSPSEKRKKGTFPCPTPFFPGGQFNSFVEISTDFSTEFSTEFFNRVFIVVWDTR